MLVASLHQGISDLMPTRLEFYENWLNPIGMRDGRIGLAPFAAVLSFLRQEGEPYTLVTSRAGQYAAQWTFDNLTPIQRSLIRALPVALRLPPCPQPGQLPLASPLRHPVPSRLPCAARV